MEKKVVHLRLPAQLQADLGVIAESHGLSVNALCTMALRGYVDYVAKYQRLPGTPTPVARAAPGPAAAAKRPAAGRRAARGSTAVKPGRNAPCHCGSGKKYKACCYPE